MLGIWVLRFSSWLFVIVKIENLKVIYDVCLVNLFKQKLTHSCFTGWYENSVQSQGEGNSDKIANKRQIASGG